MWHVPISEVSLVGHATVCKNALCSLQALNQNRDGFQISNATQAVCFVVTATRVESV
jgi:hypothetical protein